MPPLSAARFFFYGTLADPAVNRISRLIHAQLRPLGPARMRGALYGIGQRQGWYPALVFGDGLVQGQLFAAAAGFGERDLARIDAYEDFTPGNPDASLYVRELCPVTADDGQEQPALAYRYNQPLPKRARPIPGGDFAAWLAQEGLRAFGG